jgi:dihydrodipicolinate synthase/N-acetylneuraminate lyase
MVDAYKAGDEEAARKIDEETEPAYELLKVAPNPIAIKAALNLLGHEVGGHRLPLVQATDEPDPPEGRMDFRAPFSRLFQTIRRRCRQQCQLPRP